MTAAFPPGTPPSQYATVTPSTRCGIYYGPTPTPSFTLSTAGASAYVVRDYYGTTVSSGAVSGTTVTPATPGGGWAYGWYRLYLTGPTNDATYGTSCGAFNFCVIRSDSRFVANPAGVSGGSNNGAPTDQVTRGVLGLGPQRWSVADATNSAAAITDIQAGLAIDASYYTASSFLDSNRPRPQFVAFPSGGYDVLGGFGGSSGFNVYCKDETVDGSTIFVQTSAGSVSGFKVQVFSPNNSTLVETYDNLASPTTAQTAINGVSTRITVYGTGSTPGAAGPTAIGRARYNGVKAVVTALYPTVTWFEGPENEPRIDSAEAVLKMRLFNGAVKAGNASAKTLGPNPVTINANTTAASGALEIFLAAGGGTYLDGFSFHAYNQGFGDLNALRRNYAPLIPMLTKYGQQAKPLWQTEQGVFTPVYSVYHPRRARWQLLQMLVQETYGVPREQNHLWYDVSHGFWSQPTWWENTDTSLNPQAPLIRVMAEELFGKNYLSTLTFGQGGDNMYFGATWRNPTDDTRCVVLMAASAGLGSVTLTIAGATGSLTYSDPFGNTGTATVTNGRVVLPVTEMPLYLRLPAAASATVYSWGAWPAAASVVPNMVQAYTIITSTSPLLTNGVFAIGVAYDAAPTPYTAALPATPTVTFRDPIRFDRVIVWSGMPWQNLAALADFDVQTSPDGSVWTTRATVTITPPTPLSFVSSSQNVGCTLETFWDERYIFDVSFAPVTASYLRLNARAASYGGEPTAACVTAGGQGNATPQAVVQQIAVFSDDQASNRRPVLAH